MWKKKCDSINCFKKKIWKKIFNIHIQDPKVSFNNFDLIISPEHDNIKGDNVLKTKGLNTLFNKKRNKREFKIFKNNKEKKKRL